MDTHSDYAIRELGRLRLRLRHDLVFTPHRASGEAYYVIEDPVTSKFHRIGLAEYAFISLLDGDSSVNDALELVATAAPDCALSEHEAASICKWLVESELAHTSESSRANQLLAKARSDQRRSILARWNPVVFRLPLFRPDRFFQALLPWLGWMHSPPALAVWLVIVLIAGYQVAASWDRFVASSRGILAPSNWLWLLGSWILLKFIHETAHGIVCKRYGGSVREAGVLLILLAPIAYVDVTASWRFRSKWQRIQTTAAGIYIEVLVAAIAALVWNATDTGILNNVCHSVMVMASFTTVVVNANPLMRFDGYYLVTDLVEIPNLYAGGQQYLRYWARKYLFGVAAARPSWSRSRARLMTAYGVASLAWRVLLCACLTITATTLLHGAGIVLAGVAVLCWCGVPAFQLAKYLYCGESGDRPNPVRFLATAGALTAAAGLLLTLVPWPGTSRAPAVVEYAPLTAVRAASSGFVTSLCVDTGAQVAEGAVIAVLANDQLDVELAELKLALEQSRLNCRMFKQTHKMAAYQAELKHLESLLTMRREKAQQVAALTVRAPCSGQILGRNLTSLLGTYVAEGTEIVSIGNEQQKELRFSVEQQQHDVFRECVGRVVDVRLGLGRWLRAPLDHLDPRATLEPIHQALCAALGGPLPVKHRAAARGADEQQDEADSFELITPHFAGTVQLSAAQSARLRAGQLGTVTVRACRESIGAHLYDLVARWVRDRMQQ